MSSLIHPTAQVHPSARLGVHVSIGAFTIIDAQVEIGDHTTVGSHSVITGYTRIGKDNLIFQSCSIGSAPQDKKYNNEPTKLEIGDRNTIREFCSLHCGTIQEQGITRIGNDNWIMAYVHIAHDCTLGDHIIIANGTQLSGHVIVGDWAVLGGLTGVHQFVRIGEHSMTGGMTALRSDLPPYVMVNGNPASASGINSTGLKRRGFSQEAIHNLKAAYKTVYCENLNVTEAVARLSQQNAPEIQPLIDFLKHKGRGIVR